MQLPIYCALQSPSHGSECAFYNFSVQKARKARAGENTEETALGLSKVSHCMSGGNEKADMCKAQLTDMKAMCLQNAERQKLPAYTATGTLLEANADLSEPE